MSAENTRTSGRRVLTGRVVSNKMDKTVAVEVIRRVKHPRYRKYINRRNVYKAHDENNECQMDDMVQIEESRPLSRTKRWLVIERRPRNN
ncbi:MAG: 30S ribosomal protein S17 [Alphaproteobacteria bacterium]|nr:30S ribosomal protein S17 [Alphaproteobacteria bacterium]